MGMELSTRREKRYIGRKSQRLRGILEFDDPVRQEPKVLTRISGKTRWIAHARVSPIT